MFGDPCRRDHAQRDCLAVKQARTYDAFEAVAHRVTEVENCAQPLRLLFIRDNDISFDTTAMLDNMNKMVLPTLSVAPGIDSVIFTVVPSTFVFVVRFPRPYL